MTAESSGSLGRRRGRPYRFPEDNSPLTRVHGGVDQRVAWLLSASRIHADDPDLAHREKFVEVLKAQGHAADQARVSRWESGSQRVPDRVVSAYETALELSPSHLASAIQGLRRSLEPNATNVETLCTPPKELHEELDRLFESVDDDCCHGADWIALTNYLATHPEIYMRPRSWEQLTESLISQAARSVDGAYTRRFESLRTLVRHPIAQRHVVKTIGRFVTDPAAQVVMHPLTLLQEVEHPQAADVTLRLLMGGAVGMLQQGAAWTTAAKVARGHFDNEGLARLQSILVTLLAEGHPALPESDILDIAVRLPESALTRLRHVIRDSQTIARLDLMLKTGEVLPETTTRRVSARVAATAQEATPPPYRIEPDMMLQRLVREALFHGHQERRHQAAVLLSVSPYRAGVAAGLCEIVEIADDTVANRAAMLLRQLATEQQREELRRWARDDSRRQIRGVAILTLGRLPHGLQEEDEPVALEALSSAGRATQRACLYALGMSGSPVIKELSDGDDELHRRAAQWWVRTGSAIHESPRNTGHA